MTEMSFKLLLCSEKTFRLLESNQQNFLVSFMINMHFMMVCVIGKMVSSIYKEEVSLYKLVIGKFNFHNLLFV